MLASPPPAAPRVPHRERPAFMSANAESLLAMCFEVPANVVISLECWQFMLPRPLPNIA